mgnify:CR=1 FL=1
MIARYRPLLLILSLFLLPVAIGGGLFAYGWRPAAPAAHGELLTPARPLPDLLTADGQSLNSTNTATSRVAKEYINAARWAMSTYGCARCSGEVAIWRYFHTPRMSASRKMPPAAPTVSAVANSR